MTDRPRIQTMCRAATWYDPDRCEAGALLLRGGLSLLVVLALLATTAWLLFSARTRAVQWRSTIASHERVLMDAVNRELRTVSRAQWAAIAAMTIIALAVRYPLLSLPMRSDENQTLLLYSGRSLEAALWQFDTTNNHILFSVLSYFPIEVFGTSRWSARLVELATGVLLVPATALALRGLRGPVPALIGAGLVAGLPYLAAFSANARGYSLVAVLFVLAVPAALRAGARVDLAAWTFFCLLAALALFTNPAALYPFGALGAWIFAQRATSRRRFVVDVLLAGVLIAVLSWAMYGPALTAMGTEALFANPWVRPPSWLAFTSTLDVVLDGTARELWWQWGWGIPAAVTGLIVTSLIVALATDLRRQSPGRGLILALLAWTAILAAATHRVPYTRVLLPYLPCLLVVAAGAIITILRRVGFPTPDRSLVWPVAAVLIALALASARESARTLQMTDARAVMERERLLSLLDARPRLVGNRPPAHGARAYAGAGAAGRHAEHA